MWECKISCCTLFPYAGQRNGFKTGFDVEIEDANLDRDLECFSLAIRWNMGGWVSWKPMRMDPDREGTQARGKLNFATQNKVGKSLFALQHCVFFRK